MIIHSISILGRRETNEDQHNIILSPKNLSFFSIYDGHGGKFVSKYLYETLYKYFIKLSFNQINNTDRFKNYVKSVYNAVQSKLITNHSRVAKFTGSTALVALIFNNLLYVINLGDCRAIACNIRNRSVQLSVDHKPGNPDETRRIKNLGGFIAFDGMDWRVKDLSVSRSFGDLDTNPFVTYIPEVYKYSLKELKYVVLGCDGLWDVLKNQEVVNFINVQLELIKQNKIIFTHQVNKQSKNNIAKLLAEYAYKRGSQDNISVTIIFL